jgi:hypothetical protein
MGLGLPEAGEPSLDPGEGRLQLLGAVLEPLLAQPALAMVRQDHFLDHPPPPGQLDLGLLQLQGLDSGRQLAVGLLEHVDLGLQGEGLVAAAAESLLELGVLPDYLCEFEFEALY